MALGVGVDIIAISRMKDILETSGEVFIQKAFTAYEQERAVQHPDKTAYLAMIFAAKEAIFKTFGAGWDPIAELKDMEIRDGRFGEPLAVLSGRFTDLMAERGATRMLLSLSYDGDYAIAMATLA